MNDLIVSEPQEIIAYLDEDGYHEAAEYLRRCLRCIEAADAMRHEQEKDGQTRLMNTIGVVGKYDAARAALEE